MSWWVFLSALGKGGFIKAKNTSQGGGGGGEGKFIVGNF